MDSKTYIIIVTYNGMPWIQQCLNSCKGYDVVVVDNNSTDETVSFIKNNFPEVQLFPQEQNLGFGQGNNLGMRYALKQGADYVFLLNQDAYLQDDCINRLVASHQKNSDYGVLSPIHFNGEGTQLDDNFLVYLNRYKVSDTLLFDTFRNTLSELYPIEFVNAAGWLISRECLEIVGGFDPLFFHYGEDRNYCQRVQYHKFSLGVVPNASLYHDRENRNEKQFENYSEAYYASFERYLKVDWADINLTNFEATYNARAQYLLSKRKHFMLKLQFQKAKDCSTKSNLMAQLKANILKSRQVNAENQMPYL